MPTDPAQDPVLIGRAQRGEADAVAELYRVHSPAIFRYFYFRVHDRSTAEDLTGEVFLQMVEALPRYVERGLPFAAWLFRIAHARVVDHHRRSAYRQTESLSEALEDGAGDTESQALQLHEGRELQVLMQTLTGEQQTVVQLRFIEGYSLEETAQIMDKTAGAIKALQHRALRQLAQRMDR